MNTKINTKIAQIHEKVKKNVALQKYYEEENKKTQQQNIELQKTIVELNKTIIKITEQNRIIKLSKILDNSKEPTELKLKINELVREIDKCKSLLNR